MAFPLTLPSANKPAGLLRPDLSHPHLRGCTSLWAYQSAGVNVPDLIGGHHAKCYNNSVVNPGYKGMSSYIADGAAADDDGVEVPSSPAFHPSSAGFTAIVEFDFTSANVGYVGLMTRWKSAAGNNCFALTMMSNAQLFCSVSANGTASNYFYGTGTLTANTHYVVALTWYPTSADVYVNGSLNASDGTTEASIYDADAPLKIGGPLYDRGAANSNHEILEGRVYQARYYRRRLSAAEIYAISKNMWAPFSTKTHVDFSEIVAGGSTVPVLAHHYRNNLE